MSTENNPGLRPELLDDFYAECDEQLTDLRTELARLEQSLAEAAPDAAALEALFRAVHTLKGNAAIVGLREAEVLAHGLEELLRTLGQQAGGPSGQEVDLMHAVIRRLEQILSAHQAGTALPDASDLLAQLRPAPEGPSPAAPASGDIVEAARQRGLRLWSCTFLPAAERDQRGVNLDVVRQRLKGLGEMLRSEPTVRPDGSIAFVFVLAMLDAPADPDAWAADGVTFQPLDVPSPGSAAAAEARSLSVTPSHVVRVDLAHLDELMRITGELVIQRSRLDEELGRAEGRAALREVSLALGRSLRDLRQAVSRVRLVPVAETFARIPFVLRDLLRSSDKQARIAIDGGQTEIDKFVVERLKEPLLHLVRNAFVHGVEPPDERAAAGKPPEATILLRASGDGQRVTIEIRDDGRGMDLSVVAARAAALGLTVPEPFDSDAALSLLCRAGFSTREEADLAAGRGIGMTVVASIVRQLRGTIRLETTAGRGTCFTLQLPLSLSIVDALIVSIGEQPCAVPQTAVEEIIQVPGDEVRMIRQTEVVPYRAGLLPITRLRALFGLDAHHPPTLTLLVVQTERGAVGLVVDRVHTRREVVVRPLEDPLVRGPAFTGATELGDGRPILILDPLAVTKGVVRPLTNGSPKPVSTPSLRSP